MRRFVSLSALVLILFTGVVGCDSFAGRKPDSEATTRTTERGTRSTNLTPSTTRTAPTVLK